eukprot:SAG11_NODE_231_length_11932_cov_40.992817_11_plen_104_part_00
MVWQLEGFSDANGNLNDPNIDAVFLNPNNYPVSDWRTATRQRSWSGAEWRSHWRQRLSLRLAIGHVAPVLEAVDRARSNADVGRSAGRASLEWTETGCRPCVS